MIKKYHAPATPCEQLLTEDRVGTLVKDQLQKQFAALDPVQFLNQIRQAQEGMSRIGRIY